MLPELRSVEFGGAIELQEVSTPLAFLFPLLGLGCVS